MVVQRQEPGQRGKRKAPEVTPWGQARFHHAEGPEGPEVAFSMPKE